MPLHISKAEARRYGLHKRGATPAKERSDVLLPQAPFNAQERNGGPFKLILPGFVPATVNELTRGHFRERIRLAEADKEIVGFYARQQGIPLAEKKRRVGVKISKPGRKCDVDAYFKSLLDALVAHSLLVNDSPAWCELSTWEIVRGPRETVVTLEDV
jgi:hypothetical protein